MKQYVYTVVILVGFFFTNASVCAQSARIDSLRSVLPGLKGEKRADCYLELSKEYTYVDPAKVVEYGRLALSIIQEYQNKEQEAFANLLIGGGYLFAGNFEDGRKYSDIGLKIARETGHTDYICVGLNSLAAYYMNTGDYETSAAMFRETLQKADSAGLEARAATARLNLGALLTNKGERTKGLRHLMESLKYFEQEGNEQIMARILNNVAVNYHAWKDYDKALEFYERTLATYQQLNDYVGQAIVYNNIGEIYKDKEEYQKALTHYQLTIDIADSADAGDFYRAYGWVGLAEVYLLLGENKFAYENANKALSVFSELKMLEGIANARLILSQTALSERKMEEALSQVNESLELSKKIGIADLEQKGYLVKSRIYEAQKRYKEAFENMKLYAQKTDTLYNDERTNDFAQLRSELEVSEKQNEIELLQKNSQIKEIQIRRQKTQTRFLFLTLGLSVIVFFIMLNYIKSRKKASDLLEQKNKQINEQHVELIRVNETKDKFLSIIGHDLRNPIGAFKDVVGQLADYPEMFTDELRQQIIHELRDEAESTYFLLDNLLSWAKSQKNSISYRPERLELAELIESNILLNFRFSESKGIKLKTDVAAGIAAFADYNMVNLILRNLISNAVKFTEEGGEITVKAKESGNFIEIAVIDNGIGISAKNLPRLFAPDNHISTYGTNHEKGSGLGLLLCKEFVEINGGTIGVQSKPGKGSTFTFTLKKYTDTI